MTTSVQRRRGSTVQHTAFTGLEGEITVDTTKDTAVVHDGVTLGGFPLAKESLENAKTTNLTAIIGTDTAADDTFLIFDASASVMKKITRAELNNAIEVDALSNVTITGGSINGTSVGATTASTGKFTTLESSSTTTLNGTSIPTSKTLLVTTDIGVSVQAYDADLTTLGAGGSSARSFLGLAIGTDVQAYDADLTTLGAGGASARTFLGLGLADSPQFTNLTLSGRTSGRVIYATTGGLLTDSANMTFNGTTLTLANDASISGLTVGKGAGSVASNTAVGYQAGYSNVTGTDLVAVGYLAAYANTGDYNTAVGRGAAQSTTSGSFNTSVGRTALNSNTTGSNNTALGGYALLSNTTASNNTAVGYQALYTNTTGSNIVAVGKGALYSNTTASTNTAVGNEALYSNTVGTPNSAFGNSALRSNTTGSYNNAFGSTDLSIQAGALYSNTAGGANNAFGNAALGSNTTGSNNCAFGHQSLVNNTTASNNTAVGYQAGYSNTTGGESVFIGRRAGYTGNGSYNTFVGSDAGRLSTGTNNTFVGVSNGSTGACGEAMTTGSKNTIIGGYTGNQGGLDIRTASNYIVLSDGDGNPRLYSNAAQLFSPQTYAATTGAGANMFIFSDGALYRSTSSLKYKKDVQNATHGLNEVMQLRPVTYKGINDGELVFGGLIAEEVDALGLTEFVQYADDGSPDALAYGQMVSLAFKAIQELNTKLEAQALEIATLKGQ